MRRAFAFPTRPSEQIAMCACYALTLFAGWAITHPFAFRALVLRAIGA